MADEFKEKKNWDNVFLRRVIVGISSFLYDVIEITQVVKGEEQKKRVPFFYSMTGEEQYLRDFFIESDKHCDDLRPVEGNISKLPQGVFTLKTAPIDPQNLGSGYIRSEHSRQFDTDFTTEERRMSSRVTWLPININCEMKVKTTSDLERFKVWEEVIDKLWKTKVFYISYNGFERIGCMISIPEDVDISKNFQFRYGENEKRPQLVFNSQVLAYKPVIDETTTRFSEETMENFQPDINPEDQ